MKLNKLAYLLVAALVLTSGATGCKKKPGPTTPLPNPLSHGSGDSATEGSGKLNTGEGSGDTGGTPLPTDINPDLMNQNRTELQAHIVHFAYDSAAIRSGEQSHVDAVANYFKSSSAALLIEGHCDERGTEEYNRALGERRALALRNELIKLGCDGSKIVTRSFGKDRPVDTGSSEASHAKNRRGEFVVLTPK